jgi:hypothetical protein
MVSDAVVEQISSSVAASNVTLNAPFSRNVISENIIDGAGSLIATGGLTMSGNQFTLAAESPQIADPKYSSIHNIVMYNQLFAVAVAFSRHAVFVGNQSSLTSILIHADYLYDKAANVGITV